MFAAIYIPQFPLQAITSRSAAEPNAAAVVLHDEVAKRAPGKKAQVPIIAMNRAAKRSGIVLGMSATQAQARCANVIIHRRDRKAERETHEQLLVFAESLTPDYESTAPSVVTLDLFGSGRWRKDWETEAMRCRECIFQETRLHVKLGLAATPDLALAAAETAPSSGIHLVSNPRTQFKDQAIERLRPPEKMLGLLKLWGIHTIGRYLELPREEVTHRLGSEAERLWDKVAGSRTRLLRLVKPPEHFKHTCELEFDISELEPLLFLCRRALETLTSRLANHYRAATEIALTLHFADHTHTCQTIRVPDPSNDVDVLFRLLQTRLETFESESPLSGFALELMPGETKKRQFDLFQPCLTDPNRFEQTLGQLESLLGSERVGSPRVEDGFRSDAFTMDPFETVLDKDGLGLSESPERPLGLPLCRLRPPQSILVETRSEHGQRRPMRLLDGPHQGTVTQAAGPWKSSGHWWDDEGWTREEWDVQLESGQLCRLRRDGSEWFLEGVYE